MAIPKATSLGLLLGFTTLVLAGVVSFRAVAGAIREGEWVAHTLQAKESLKGLSGALADAETGRRGYALTGDERYLAPYRAARARAEAGLQVLAELTRDNALQRERLERLRPAIGARLALLEQQVRDQGRGEAAGEERTARGREIMERIRTTLAAMEQDEDGLLEARRVAAGRGARRSLWVLSLGSALGLGLVGLAFGLTTLEARRRERADAERLRSDAQLRAVLDNSPTAISLKDLEGRFLLVNPRFESLLPGGASPIGRTEHELLPSALADARRGKDLEALARRAPVESEERYEHEGALRTYDAVRFPLLDAQGEPYAVACIRADVSERRRLEQELDRFFRLSSDLLFIGKADGSVQHLNPAWETLLGHPMESLRGRPVMELVHPEDRQATEALSSRLAEAGAVSGFENRMRCRDGSYRWVQWSVLRDREQGLSYAIARDVTEQKRTLDELRRARDAAEAANGELEAFSYSVSHDLRAPLRHIDGFVDLLGRKAAQGLDESGRRYLRVISDAARQMGALIDDLLAFSRMGRAEMARARVDLAELLADVLRQGVDADGRSIVWDIQPLPRVAGDRAMLRVVLDNLVSNAVKYTRRRDPAHIQVGSAPGREGEVVVFVRDDGAGFDMRYAGKLFGVFQRLHRAEEFEGTGIGLATVRRIVTRHGGRAWAEGQPDSGATFYVALPAPEGVFA